LAQAKATQSPAACRTAPKVFPTPSPWTASSRGVRTTAEAKDRAQLILGAVSLVIWFSVAFTLAVSWLLAGAAESRAILAGFIALAVAALPWLAYRPLVRFLAR
jgi:hypothetical protein